MATVPALACPPGSSLTCLFDLADRGALHKAISLENEVHIIEETQLFQSFEPIQTLLLSSKKVKQPGRWPPVSVIPGGAGHWPGRPVIHLAQMNCPWALRKVLL